MGWQANYVRRHPDFSAVERALEIGAGGFATAIELARANPNKEFYGVDFVLSPLALENLADAPRNLTVVKHDARDLAIFAEGYFDIVYSIAVMEHIRELELHLRETWRILKPGGSYWFWQAPFWSCSRGHHFRHGAVDCPIPHYAHLYMSPDELKSLLRDNGHEAEKAESVVSFIYDRGDLSRMGRSETRNVIENSSFEIAAWEDDEDDKFDAVGAARVLSNNLYSIPEEDLRYKGARVHLVKSA